MSDLISRSELYDQLANKLTWLMRYGDDVYLDVGSDIKDVIDNMSTAYSIANVIEKLERYPLGDLGCQELNEIIEIVKQGGVSDDVCEWTSTQINNEWKPSCEPNSTYNVFGVAWFRKCPYCGKKIKAV